MTEILESIKNNLIVLTFLGTAIAGVINFYQFVRVRKDSQRQTEYSNYHALIERLNLPEVGTGHPLLDKQKSAAFELRFYTRYKSLTRDILSGWIPRVSGLHGLGSIMKETLEVLGQPYKEK